MRDPTSDEKPRPPSRSDIEAVDWLIRLMALSSECESTAARESTQEELNRWATESPANLRSFLKTASIFQALGECEAEMINELAVYVDSNRNLVSLVLPGRQLAPADASKRSIAAKWQANGSWLKRAVAAAAMVAVITCGAFLWQWAQWTTYSTVAGERRRISLEDGSVVFLDEQSKIRVFYSNARRRIRFLRGQALFDVKHDGRRPMLVSTDTADIQDVGTQFDLEGNNGSTRVVVVDGTVQVNATPDSFIPLISLLDGTSSQTEQNPQIRPLILTKGQGAEIARKGIIPSGQVDVDSIVGWHSDPLVLERQPLAVVAARFNRDNRKQLHIADAAAGAKRISGRYKTGDPEELVHALTELYPDLEVRETEDGWIVEAQNQKVISR